MQITKAAQARLKGISKQAQALGRQVENKELTIIGFLRAVILALDEPGRDKNDVGLSIANDALLYLRRRGDTDREWLIGLFERHGNLVYMRKTGGKLHRFTVPHGKPDAVPAIDESALVSELQQKLGTGDAHDRKGRSAPLFDKSIRSQTMQASKFAK